MERVRDLTSARAYLPLARRLPLFFGAVKFQESVFALPFAYSGMVLAAGGFPTWHQLIWITVAMVSARAFGMSANRVLDRHIDAMNPRTSGRHLPSGALKVSDVTALAVVSLVVFFVAAAQLNTLALLLAPVAAGYLAVYPLTKRFTWAANLALGWALAIAPAGAWVGVKGSLSWEPVILATAIALWAGSFDILYHIPDRDFYIGEGLHSVPQRFGIEASFRLARTLDALAIGCLVLLGLGMQLAYPYFAGCGLALALLVYKHLRVTPRDPSRIGPSFFRMNGYVSTIMLVATLVAVLVE